MTNKDFNEVFSKRLRLYMAEYNMTQADLAKRLKVGTTSVYNWYNGVKTPRMDKVDKMCEIFHCKRSDLIEDKPAASAPSGDAALGEGDIAKIFEQYGTDTVEQRAALSAALNSLSLPPEKLELMRQVLQMDPDQAAAFLPLAKSIVKTP